MGSKYNHASYRVTPQDLANVVNEHASEWGATAYFDVRLGGGQKSLCYVDVVIRDGIFTPTGAELIRSRWPLSDRDASLWPGNMLHALMNAYTVLEREPWLWPARKRRHASGEG